MLHYNCVVNVGGAVHTRVPKENVSAPEIIILRHLHGNDAVLKIKPAGTSNAPQRELRAELEYRYGAKRVAALFGIAGATLPTELDDVSRIAHLDDDDDEGVKPGTAPAMSAADLGIEGAAETPRKNGQFQKKAA